MQIEELKSECSKGKKEYTWLQMVGLALIVICSIVGGALIGPLAGMLPLAEKKQERAML